MSSWMRRLARHLADVRAAHPEDHLLVVFDIDGTILDLRHMVRHVLLAFDREHGTHHFHGLDPDDIDVHENDVGSFLERWGVAAGHRDRVLRWYLDHRWTPEVVRGAHAAFPDVMAVIRWFQIQPGTSVALNTGRPESVRADTLASLDTLGRAHRVRFDPDLVRMNPGTWQEDVAAAKVDALRSLAADGYRPAAVVDNEPAMIEAMAADHPDGDILFLHARTVFESRRPLPQGTPAGHRYDLRTLIGEDDLPEHVELVWHGVNDQANLRHFLASPVRWGECDVRRDLDGRLALRHDPFGETDASAGADPPAEPLLAEDLLAAARDGGKAVKLDVKEPGVLDDVLRLARRVGVASGDLWVNGRVDVLGPEGLRRVGEEHPGAVVQCPIDRLAPAVITAPTRARARLAEIASWGVSRFSLAFDTDRTAALLDRLDQWGYEVNLYAVQGLDDFLRAVVLLPRSVTADFNFPEWHYFGRGAGSGGRHHRYHLDPAPVDVDVA